MGKDLIIYWEQVNQLVKSRLSVGLQDLRSMQSITPNELYVIDELCQKLVAEAQAMFPYQVTAFPIGFGRGSGGIKMRFEDASHAVLFKLSLVTK